MALSLKALTAVRLNSSTGGGVTTAISTTTINTPKGWLIKNMFFSNIDTTNNVTMDLFLRQGIGGTQDRLLYKAVAVNANTVVKLTDEITLNQNNATPDILYAKLVASLSTPQVDCVINGVERDQ